MSEEEFLGLMSIEYTVKYIININSNRYCPFNFNYLLMAIEVMRRYTYSKAAVNFLIYFEVNKLYITIVYMSYVCFVC